MPVFYFSHRLHPSSLFLAFPLVFVLIFSGWSCLFGFPLSPLCGCLSCLCLFFHRDLSLGSFLICLFLQASFVLPGAVSPLLIDVNTDCWFWTLLGEGRRVRCGRTTLKGPRERMLGGWSGQLRGYPYFADAHFSSWPEVWHFFPRVLGGGLDLPDSLLSLPHCFCTLLPWSPAFPSWTSCFLWSTFYRLCSCLLWSTHLEGACIDISHKSNSYTWSTSASQGQKQAGETHDPGPLGTEPEWNPENLKHRNKLREWWMVTRKEPREYFCHFNLHKHLFITYPEINHVLGSEYYLLSIYKKDLCHLNSFWGF